MIPQLIDALERQADKGLLELLDARAKIKVLEAQNRDLQARNQELSEQLDAHKAEARHVTAGRSQGLAALMARRPRHHVLPNEPTGDTPLDGADNDTASPPHESAPKSQARSRDQSQSQGQAQSQNKAAPLPANEPAPRGDPPARSEPQAQLDGQADVRQGPQSRLPIDEAPSPQALLDEWYQRYTETFFKGHTRPLKVGIHEDLVAREPWPEKLVRRALACYVHLPRYLKAVRAGAERVGLDGESDGVVSEGEAKYARKQLDELQAQNRTRQAKRRERQRQQEKEERLERKISELLAKHEH